MIKGAYNHKNNNVVFTDGVDQIIIHGIAGECRCMIYAIGHHAINFAPVYMDYTDGGALLAGALRDVETQAHRYVYMASKKLAGLDGYDTGDRWFEVIESASAIARLSERLAFQIENDESAWDKAVLQYVNEDLTE